MAKGLHIGYGIGQGFAGVATGPGRVRDLADALGVSRQVMSNQLACLRGCGLVEAVPDGRRTWYRLADAHLAPALDELLRVVLYVEPGCCAGESCTCA